MLKWNVSWLEADLHFNIFFNYGSLFFKLQNKSKEENIYKRFQNFGLSMFSSFQFFILGIDVVLLLHFTWSPNTGWVSTSPTCVAQGWEERASVCCGALWYPHCGHIFARSEVLSSPQRKVTIYRGLHLHCKWEALDGTSVHKFLFCSTMRESTCYSMDIRQSHT